MKPTPTQRRLYAKKSLGQNFLVNAGVVEQIITAAQISPDDTVIEVGPGTGVMTRALAPRARRVIAIEKDHRLIPGLQRDLAEFGNVTIIEDDVLKSDPHTWDVTVGEYIIVANLPYYITSYFLRTMFEDWPRAKRAILMVQREVGSRMVATPPDMNLLGLSVQLYATVSRVMRVSRGSFRPSPRVDSSVMCIEPRALSDTQRATAQRAIALAREAFQHKRKKLPETLSAKLGIAAPSRPQELTPEQWLSLV